MDKKGLSLNKLNSLLIVWQRQLSLGDWNLSIKIVEFNRKDYIQSGDIRVFPEEKKAVVLLTNAPFKDEEYVLVHELVHLILWDLDTFSEKIILERFPEKLVGKHGKYMDKLENTVDHLTKIFINNVNINEDNNA